ncbi:MAG: hypothetical protein QME45_04255 [Clostridiales bacterium]|nr:hypothetical protein [Clostridiales bacterium]
MRQWRITIPGVLPGLNEYINAERKNKYMAAAVKKKIERDIMLIAKAQLKNTTINKPVTMEYTWIVPDRRRDKDNIAFAKKFIQDALVKTGILRDDGWNEITGFTDKFKVDRENPSVEINIREACGNGE